MSLLILTKKFLENEGYICTIHAGLNSVWTYCLFCKAYTWQEPMARVFPEYKYICTKCETHSIMVN